MNILELTSLVLTELIKINNKLKKLNSNVKKAIINFQPQVYNLLQIVNVDSFFKIQFYRIILILFFLQLLFCASYKRPNWILTTEHSNHITTFKNSIQFQFFIEPHSDLTYVNNLISDIFTFVDILETYPYLEIRNSLYKIVVYKHYKSYKEYRPFQVESLAHFDRNKKEIHIPLTIYYNHLGLEYPTPKFVMYHELIHAFLENCCEYSLWLNEGLALLLQNVQEKFVCNQTKILFPYGLISHKNILIDKNFELPIYPNFESLYTIYEHNLISGFFVYYLWGNRELLNTIHIIKNTSLYEFYTNNDLKKYQILKSKFYEWIKKIPNHEFYILGC